MAFIQLPVLDDRSVFHVVEENFKRVDLKTYAIRMIYCGEHTLARDQMLQYFRKSVANVNASYCEIYVYGLLLVYDHHFIHILEGSEDTVHRQLRFLFQAEEKYIKEMVKKDEEEKNAESVVLDCQSEPPSKPERMMFRRLKMLIVYHSITTRHFKEWRGFLANPATLVSNLNARGPVEEHMEQLRVFLEKIGRFCNLAEEEENLNFETLKTGDSRMEVLPEVGLLDYLLSSPYIFDLRDVYKKHRIVDDMVLYVELIWPLPNQFTPRHLYKLKIDDSFVEPLPVMPWELVTKEEKDEEAVEKEEDSDSS